VWGHRTRRLPRAWPPPGGPFRDESLAFHAIAPRLSKRDLREGTLKKLWSDLFGSNFVNPKARARKEPRRPRRHISFACEEAAAELDALERQRLRQTGELPDWFVDEVKRLVRKG
jgi:hypothetical protein